MEEVVTQTLALGVADCDLRGVQSGWAAVLARKCTTAQRGAVQQIQPAKARLLSQWLHSLTPSERVAVAGLGIKILNILVCSAYTCVLSMSNISNHPKYLRVISE